jgi:hypothetical protein
MGWDGGDASGGEDCVGMCERCSEEDSEDACRLCIFVCLGGMMLARSCRAV